MKFVFVVPEAENYAVFLFSSLLKERGHEVHLVFDPRLFATDEINQPFLSKIFDIRKHNVRTIERLRPDFVCFSVYTQDYRWSVGMAEMVRKRIDTPIVFGGVHCTLCPEEVIKEPCIDIVCVGEGEGAVMELAEGANPGRISNLMTKTDKGSLRSLIDLDTLPLPDKDLLYDQKPVFSRDYTIATSRGCPYQCTFCASSAINRVYRERELGKYLRQRSVEHVMKELLWAKKKYKPRSIYFTDDNLTLSTSWLEQFSKEYKQWINLPFYCTCNPGTIKMNQITLLKKSGCQMIGFGLQSVNENTRKNLLKRTGGNDYIMEVCAACKKLGIRFSFDHIFDLPTEPIEAQEEALAFYAKTKPDVINTFTMTYLPKIELNSYLNDSDRVEVEKGNLRTGMFLRSNSVYASMFSLIPLLPQRLVEWLIKRRAGGSVFNVRMGFYARLVAKDIRRMFIGRWSDVLFPIKLLVINIRDNLKIKLGDLLCPKHILRNG